MDCIIGDRDWGWVGECVYSTVLHYIDGMVYKYIYI